MAFILIVKRAAYDKARTSVQANFQPEADEKDAAFDDALNQLEDRWQLAVSIFPDLTDIRKRLNRTAHRLAFAYVTVLLESKQFQNRIKLADSMEASFLIRYFGSNQKTLLFAKELIEVGHKAALVELNRHVEVLGSDFDSEPLILKLRTQFKVVESDSVAYMKRQVINNNSLENAKMLAHVSGYEVTLKKGGFFSLDNYEVRNIASNKQISFNFSDDFIHWVVQNLCQK